MRPQQYAWPTLISALLLSRASSATLYVSLNSTNPVPPYADWSTAATNIQDAVDSANAGDFVLVTNGIYQTGGRPANGYGLTNRVVIDKGVTVQSVNGPATTYIQGYQMPGTLNGSNAIRCVYMTSNAVLSGFTLTGGATSNFTTVLQYAQDESGGGIWCESLTALVSNCVIVSNSSFLYGAGAYGGMLRDCQIINNTNQSLGSNGGGGGAANSALFDSTIAGNSIGGDGFACGGTFSCTLSNCLVASNSGSGVLECTLNNCTIASNTNVTYAGGACISTLYNCLVYNNRGPRGGGAYDSLLNSCVLSNNFAVTGGGAYYDSSATNPPGQSNIVVGNSSTYTGGGVYVGVNFAGLNSNLTGWMFISNSAVSDGGGLYLQSGPTFVKNCTFSGNSCGGNGGGLCGPTTYIDSASNCTFLGNVASNGGGAYSIALTNCYLSGNRAGNGGGVYGIAENCILDNNVATNDGGGLYYSNLGSATIMNCSFTNNSALNGGGAYVAGSFSFSNCTFWANSATNGGGVNGGGLVYCIVSGNMAKGNGGGACNPLSIANCLFAGNSAGTNGGGIYEYPFQTGPITSSTIAKNSAVNGGGAYLPPSGSSGITNCIIYGNSAPTNMNYFRGTGINLGAFSFCCTVPLPLTAQGKNNNNITNDPAFVNLAGDFHLSSNSPCINSGNNAYVTTSVDLDGNPRIVAGTVDIGAYEYQTPVSRISYAWLEQYGLPINTNTDTADPDHDGLNNYQEWIAGTNPTNALSVLAMLPPMPTNNPAGLVVGWQSVNNRTYFLQSSTNLGMHPAFTTVQSNIVGQAGITGYTDTNTEGDGTYFYRVGVQ